MATIALYANQINQMPSLIADLKSSVSDYKTELSSLNTKALTIDSSICNLDAVISSLQSSTQTQEDKITSLESFHQATETFIAEAERIDNGVAELINKRKKEFYGSYTYLKPNSEKEWWEKGLDWLGKKLVSVGEWCKENWKVLVTIAIVIVAVALLLTGVGGILAAMAIGALFGTLIGGIIGGVASALTGGSIFEGIRDGAFTGAIAGIIAGGMAFAMTAGIGSTLIIGAVSGAGSSLVSDAGDILITGANLTLTDVLVNMLLSGVLGLAFAGAGRGVARGFQAFRTRGTQPSTNMSGPVTFTTPKDKVTLQTVLQTGAYVRGCNAALKDGALSSTGRVPTHRTRLQHQASQAARRERARAAAAGKPYRGEAGHVPDTTWANNPIPHSWLDLSPSVNRSLGGQAGGYPIGFQPTKFVFSNPFNSYISRSFGGVIARPVRELVPIR